MPNMFREEQESQLGWQATKSGEPDDIQSHKLTDTLYFVVNDGKPTGECRSVSYV